MVSSSAHYPTPFVANSLRPADACVIVLHGLGADGRDFMPVAAALNFPARANCRFVFPNAPTRPVTVNGGHKMPAWYDIYELSLARKIDHEALQDAARHIHELIAAQCAQGIAPERILVAGFSQGGAVAIEAALTASQPLGGLLVMSSYFATERSIAPSAANARLPVLVQHGTQDPVVPEVLGRQAFEALQARGYLADYQTYTMAHSVCPEQMEHIGQWLAKLLPSQAE